MSIKLRTILALLLIAVFIIPLACSSSGASQFKSNGVEATRYDMGDDIIAPDFTAKDVITGQTITLSSYEGSAVLLNFVNYGCSSSLNSVVSRQLTDIKEVYNQRGDFIPLSVFCGCCPEEVLRDFAEDNELIWPWILDTDYSIINNYDEHLGMYGYPTLILIDGEQRIREVAGYTDQKELAGKLDQLVNKNK